MTSPPLLTEAELREIEEGLKGITMDEHWVPRPITKAVWTIRALQEYVQHKEGCSLRHWSTRGRGALGQCTCGLADLQERMK